MLREAKCNPVPSSVTACERLPGSLFTSFSNGEIVSYTSGRCLKTCRTSIGNVVWVHNGDIAQEVSESLLVLRRRQQAMLPEEENQSVYDFR